MDQPVENMELQKAAMVSEIEKGLRQHISQQVNSAVDRAINPLIARVKEESGRRKNETQSLKAKLEERDAEIAGYKLENDLLRSQLVALLEMKKRLPSTPGEDDVRSSARSCSPSLVPFRDYETALLEVKTLEDLLGKSTERHRTETKARQILINRARSSKDTARRWKEYHERFIAELSWKNNHTSTIGHYRSKDPTIAEQSDADPGAMDSISLNLPEPPSPGITELEDVVGFNGALLVNASATASQAGSHQGDISANVEPSDQINHTSVGDCTTITPQNPWNEKNHISFSQSDTVPVTQLLEKKSPLNDTEMYRQSSGSQNDQDTAVIVKEKTIKRRRCNPPPTITVKEEPDSQCVESHPSRSFERAMTLDLDETGDTVDTPRRRKRREYIRQRTDLRPVKMNLPGLSSWERSTNISQEIEGTIAEDFIKNKIENPPVSDALGTLNTSNPTRSRLMSDRRGQHDNKHGNLDRLVQAFGEDGSQPKGAEKSHPNPNQTSSARKEKSKERLISLLEIQGENKENAPPRGDPRNGKGLKNSHSATSIARIPGSAVFKIPPHSTSTNRKAPDPKDPLRSPATPLSSSSKSKLRDRPVSSLNLQDFKINPNANHGLDYAFTETVRGRSARQCLRGCTDPSCCGPMMRQLAATLRPTLPRAAFPASPEDVSLTDDELLLKWHLGDAWDRGHVESLDSSRRDELLLLARTRLLAERHGRHKMVGERGNSPPGYWRTEMPSTQEIEKDREKARSMEREKVMERYQEAMRGGRWIFRDE